MKWLAGLLRRALLHRPSASAAVRRSGTVARGGAVKPAAQPVVVSPEDVFPPFAGYSHAALVPAGARLVFVSGQLGIDREGHTPPDAEAQAAQCLRNVEAILKGSGGLGLQHAVRLNAYVTDRAHLQGYMRARDAALQAAGFASTADRDDNSKRRPPASTLMVVSGFARPEFLVEVEAVAAALE